MLKLIPPLSYDFGDNQTTLVKVSSRGLRGSDRDVLIKRAGHEFAALLDKVELFPGEVLAHNIALGSTEKIGSNRNGDGFREAVLDRYHPTFVKYGRCYRQHKNKDLKKSYGRVIKSAYNNRMGRVELLLAYNGDEAAAKRNGGLVADKEIEKLAAGDDFPTSQACRVSHDVCSSCNNKARRREDYCDEDTCQYGGLKHHITKVAEDGHVLHADNPDPVFFDISSVPRGADRISFTLSMLEKRASCHHDGHQFGGAYLADSLQLTVPAGLLMPDGCSVKTAGLLDCLADLAAAEALIEHRPAGPHNLAFSPQAREKLAEYPVLRTRQQLHGQLAALRDCGVVLPPAEFFRLVLGDEKQAADAADAAAPHLSHIFRRLSDDGYAAELLEQNPYDVRDAASSLSARMWAEKVAADYSLRPDCLQVRIHKASLRGCPEVLPSTNGLVKTAALQADADDPGVRLAYHYGLYQISVADAVRRSDPQQFPLTSTLLVRGNHLA